MIDKTCSYNLKAVYHPIKLIFKLNDAEDFTRTELQLCALMQGLLNIHEYLWALVDSDYKDDESAIQHTQSHSLEIGDMLGEMLLK